MEGEQERLQGYYRRGGRLLSCLTYLRLEFSVCNERVLFMTAENSVPLIYVVFKQYCLNGNLSLLSLGSFSTNFFSISVFFGVDLSLLTGAVP